MSDSQIRLHHALAMGQHTEGYGSMGSTSGGGRNPGYAKGGSVHMAHKQHHVPHAGHHNMDGGIHKKGHTETHKSHGHGLGVQHQETGGVGEGGETHGPHQSASKGPSDNQFGSHMPGGKGSSLGRW